MPEIVINLHMHTQYSDGTGTHREIASAALRAGLQAVIVTDHNIRVPEKEGYYDEDGKQILVLVGEEIHDRTTPAQNNHLLVVGADQELAGLAEDTQKLIDTVNELGGLSFIAHPIDPPAPKFNQGDFSWDRWDVSGYTGIELWNGFSEFKTRLKDIPRAVWYAYQPRRVARGPIPETLALWDDLTRQGRRVVAIGGSDAHAMHASLGPLKRTLFPYEFHFKSVNTHLLIPTELTGDLDTDRGLIYEALRNGHAFIGYDLPRATTGFRYTARTPEETVQMGDELKFREGTLLKIELPAPADCVLVQNGEAVHSWHQTADCEYQVLEPGVYRIEAYLPYRGRQRGWIFSNPIYIR